MRDLPPSADEAYDVESNHSTYSQSNWECKKWEEDQADLDESAVSNNRQPVIAIKWTIE